MADLQGWPFLSPPRIQMQKCNKCSGEFFSTINHRRHMLLHRRNLNIDKDSTTKNRGLLQAFWDKLSVEESMEIVSLGDVSLAGVEGSLILKELISLILKPRCTSLPLSYIKSGSALLDILQARPSRFPISSSDLFSILDEASEKTFLCAGTAGSLQKYVFDGDAGKIGLEMRNLVAFISFLIEQKLINACLAAKDAEALRNHKLLLEEEEAAQRRQAALLEKKRLKKLRQKEQRAKELTSVEKNSSPEDISTTPPMPNTIDAPDSNPETSEIFYSPTSSLDLVQIMNVDNDENDYENGYPDSGTYKIVEHKTLHQNGQRRVVNNSHGLASRMQRIANNNCQTAKPGATQKHGSKVWEPKPKSETDEEICNTMSVLAENVPVEDKKGEVLIGSIPVNLDTCRSKQNNGILAIASENNGNCCASALSRSVENGIHGKLDKNEAVQRTANHSTVRLWRQVSRYENGTQLPTQNSSEASTVGLVSSCNGCDYNTSPLMITGHQVSSRSSSHVAEAFLSKRWKEAISSDHMKLVSFSESKSSEALDDNQSLRLSSVIKPKIEKGSKVKYVPKHRSVT